MAKLPSSLKIVLLVVLVPLLWSDASPFNSLMLQEGTSTTEMHIDKTSLDNDKALPLNAITDSNKSTGKKLFSFDESSFVKLKGYKVFPKDSGKSNIMKILFPKNQLIEKNSSNPVNDEILSSIRRDDAKDLKNDFIQVDDILLVRDPMNIDLQSKNELSEDDIATTEYSSPDIDNTEKPWKDLTLAERLKIAAKRRMLKKFAKLELTMQRDLVKREDAHSDKFKPIDKHEKKGNATIENMKGTQKPDDTVQNNESTLNESETISATLQVKKDDSQIEITERTEGIFIERPNESQPIDENTAMSSPTEKDDSVISSETETQKTASNKSETLDKDVVEHREDKSSTMPSKPAQVSSPLGNTSLSDGDATVGDAKLPSNDEVKERLTENHLPSDTEKPEQTLQSTTESDDTVAPNEEDSGLGSKFKHQIDVQLTPRESIKESVGEKLELGQQKKDSVEVNQGISEKNTEVMQQSEPRKEDQISDNETAAAEENSKFESDQSRNSTSSDTSSSSSSSSSSVSGKVSQTHKSENQEEAQREREDQNKNAHKAEANASKSEQPNSAANSRSHIGGVLSRIFSNQGHPLVRRILLGASENASTRARESARRSETAPQLQLSLFKPNLFVSPFSPLFKLHTPILRHKRHVKREAKEEDVFLTPKTFEPFVLSTTKRPRLIDRYRAMSSDEKAEKVGNILEKIMHGVTIAGHVDGFLTHRAKESVKILHKIFITSEESN